LPQRNDDHAGAVSAFFHDAKARVDTTELPLVQPAPAVMGPIPAFSCSASIGLITTCHDVRTPEKASYCPIAANLNKNGYACREIRHGRRPNPDHLMRIATWNVKSIGQRIEKPQRWLREQAADTSV